MRVNSQWINLIFRVCPDFNASVNQAQNDEQHGRLVGLYTGHNICKDFEHFAELPLQCSASCGGGVRRRLIKCVNTKAETDDDLNPAQCDRELQPEGTQKCNLQECKSAPSGEESDTCVASACELVSVTAC